MITKKVGLTLVVVGTIGLFVSVAFQSTPFMATVHQFLGDGFLSAGFLSVLALLAGLLQVGFWPVPPRNRGKKG